jgi:hypothetical protein
MAIGDFAIPVWIAPNPIPGGTLTHISAIGSYLVRTGKGWLTGISINTPATSNATLTVYDGTDATGAVMAVIDVSKGNPNAQTASPWGFSTGLFLVLAGNAADITLVSHSA